MALRKKPFIQLDTSDNSKSMINIKRNLKSLELKLDEVLERQIQLADILTEHNILLRRNLGLSAQKQEQNPSKPEQSASSLAAKEETEEDEEEEEENEDKPLSLPAATPKHIPGKMLKGKKRRLITSSSSGHSKFPLQTEDDVNKINEELKGSNKNEIIKLMTQLLAGTIANIERLMETELVYNFNYDGTKGKIALKSFANFVSALYEATKRPDSTREYFVFELRVTFRKLKNKFQKRLQKQRELDPLKAPVEDMDLSIFPDTSNSV